MTDHFPHTIRSLAYQMSRTPPIHIGEWQSTDVSKSQLHATYEMTDVTLRLAIPETIEQLSTGMYPFVNEVWANEHFLERVGGMPVNPPPSHERWPWSRHNGNHISADQFSHTYPERMWPKHAGNCHGPYAYAPSEAGGIQAVDQHGQGDVTHVCHGHKGIRFMYGDLSDVVDLLIRNPLTRQAYLPIWFPEDTGAHHRMRVPCTLGYHFMVRNNQLSCRYYMRSCDLVRHFADDVYLAARLTQWICGHMNDGGVRVTPGQLVMHIASLHAFVGDAYRLGEMTR